MNKISRINKQARQFLYQQGFNEICEISDFTKFCNRSYYIIAKYGLQLKAKEDNLFAGDEWDDPVCRDNLVKRIEKFLKKHNWKSKA